MRISARRVRRDAESHSRPDQRAGERNALHGDAGVETKSFAQLAWEEEAKRERAVATSVWRDQGRASAILAAKIS